MKLGDTQFGQILRNPIYMGKIVVPEYKDEEACLVNGLHQALVSESLFLKVQRILESRRNKNLHVVGKSKLREELPLRGHLKCYKCGRIWTGSVSKGNGGKYAYYHCHNECGERAHEKFSSQLQTLKPKPEIAELYLAMMEKTFKQKEGDREHQLRKLKADLERHNENLLKFDQQRYITGELAHDSYVRLKEHTQSQIDSLKLRIDELTFSDTAFEKYSRYGMSFLTHMDLYYEMATLEVKQKILGSIFPQKLVFEDENYRTDGMNSALALILQSSSDLQKQKSGESIFSEKFSADVPRRGLEPPHLTAPEPKSGVSTNSTTWAGQAISSLLNILVKVNEA